MLDEQTRLELKAAVKAKYSHYHGEWHPSVDALWLAYPNEYCWPGYSWHEFGHTLVEISDGNMWSQIDVVEGLHSQEVIFNANPDLK